MKIIPRPKKVIIKSGYLDYKETILLDKTSMTDLTKASIEYLKENTPWSYKEGTKLTLFKDEQLKDEQYQLTIDDQGIFLAYGSEVACYYGVLSLIQVLRQKDSKGMPFMFIDDYPDFKDRGLMLDISRNRVYKVETFYKIIDFLSKLKVNQLQFNVEGNSFYYESKDQYYHSKDQMLTTSDIKLIDAYAKKRFIKLVANQNSFGHMCFWLNQPEFNEMAESPDGFTYRWMVNSPPMTLNPLHEKSVIFVKELFEEYLEGFSSDIVNIGADEPFELGFEKTKEAVEKHGKGKVYLDFVNQIYDYISAKGKKVMMWGDVIKNHEESLGDFKKDIIALEWGYDENDFNDEVLQKYVKHGIDYYVCPGTSMWNSIAGIHQNMIPNIKRAAKIGLKNNAIGLLNTDWGDGGSWQQLSLSYIPYAMGASYAWHANTEQDEDILDYLDKNVFMSQKESLARFLMDLGKYSEIEKKKPDNATKLFKLLYIQQTDHINLGNNFSDPMFIIKDRHYLDNQIYLDYIHFFEQMRNRFEQIEFSCRDSGIIKTEINYALKLLHAASYLGDYVTNLHEHSLEKFKALYELFLEASDHFDSAWSYNNKLSDFKLSKMRMNDLKYKLEAIIKNTNG